MVERLKRLVETGTLLKHASMLNVKTRAPDPLRLAVLTAALLAVVLAAYFPALYDGFVFDDEQYLLGNPVFRDGVQGRDFTWALTTTYASNWHPLTWWSHALDVGVFGFAPRGHHAMNLLLHAANAAVMFLTLQGLTGAVGRSLLAAALFAVHPLRVESVAWVAERKDLLCGLLVLGSLAAYRRHARHPTLPRYLIVLGFFLLALLAKPMAVTLPFVLLLLDVWPLGRLKYCGGGGPRSRWLGLFTEKVPFFVLAALSAAITLSAQSTGRAFQLMERYPMGERLGNALVAYALYLQRTIWPVGLSPLYPYPPRGWEPRVVLVALAILMVLTLIAWWWRRCGWPLTGWLWYLGTLVPVIGLVQVGAQSSADRYTYLPSLGLCVVAAWAGGALVEKLPRTRAVAGAAAGILLIVLSALARRQVGWWSDEITLFSRAVDVTQGNWVAHNNLGRALARAGRTTEAEAQFVTALAINPEADRAHFNLGLALDLRGDLSGAEQHYRAAVHARPDNVEARTNLGAALLRLGRPAEAAEELRTALRMNPSDRYAAVNLERAQRAMAAAGDAK